MTLVVRNDGLWSSGPDIAIATPFALVTGMHELRYVDSATGTDVEDGGQNPLDPLASVFGAANGAYTEVTTAKSAIIVVAAGHEEDITGDAAFNWAKTNITVIGLGSGTTRPRFNLELDAALNNITITGALNRFHNCWFVGGANKPGAGKSRIDVSVAGVEFVGCQFDCGANDDGEMLKYSNAASDHGRVEDCTFTVTADGAVRGLYVSGACDNFVCKNCTFDGGSWGWTTEAFTMSAATVGYQIRDLVLTNASFMSVSNSAATGYLAGIDPDTTSGWNVAVPEGEV